MSRSKKEVRATNVLQGKVNSKSVSHQAREWNETELGRGGYRNEAKITSIQWIATTTTTTTTATTTTANYFTATHATVVVVVVVVVDSHQ